MKMLRVVPKAGWKMHDWLGEVTKYWPFKWSAPTAPSVARILPEMGG